MGMEKINVGVIGCGTISGIYLKNLPSFKLINVAACADLVMERAEARAQQYGIPSACAVEDRKSVV